VSMALDPVGEVPAASARRHGRRLPVVIGLCFLVMGGVVVMAVFGWIIAPQDPNAQNIVLGLSKPSASHWLGTDSLGRDVLSRVIAGARAALVGPLVVAVVSSLAGNVLGLLAGFKGGRIDAMIMRWVDLMLSLPGLLLIIVVAGMVQGGYWLAVALLAVLTIPFDTRVMRGATLEQVPRPYVEAARTLGVSDWRIMTSHIWPNVAPIAVANAFLIFSGSLVALAGLSFLGLGASPGTADWGLMISEAQPLLFANPVAALAPAAILVATAISMNLIGDWLYDRLSSRGAAR
jgi:peptide/nickel transport system permease protein